MESAYSLVLIPIILGVLIAAIGWEVMVPFGLAAGLFAAAGILMANVDKVTSFGLGGIIMITQMGLLSAAAIGGLAGAVLGRIAQSAINWGLGKTSKSEADGATIINNKPSQISRTPVDSEVLILASSRTEALKKAGAIPELTIAADENPVDMHDGTFQLLTARGPKCLEHPDLVSVKEKPRSWTN